jgi:hypothetical protein
VNREALIVLSKADPVALILAQHAQIAALTARIRAYARSGSMTQESKSVTVEERKPRSLLLMPFRFIG